MNKSFLGIDLGTSSVKVICSDFSGNTQKSNASYDNISLDGWKNAIVSALKEIDLSSVCAVGLSSQVGTYIINEKDIINWYDSFGKEELSEIKNTHSDETFLNEISMIHPDIISYPIPRLKYIKSAFAEVKSVFQPKDYIGKLLTGNLVTDPYSWRGLANLSTKKYSKFFLDKLEIDCLPEMTDYCNPIGFVTEEFSKLSGLPKNIPVIAGLNDFYSSLLGMGINKAGDIFDITGTSEHLGVIEQQINKNTTMVSSPYFENFVHYGVTASSGASLKFGIDNFSCDKLKITENIIKKSPIFTPYLNGERAPIFDTDAKGTFFGVNSDCGKDEFAYSVLEGVAFSLYHIYDNMGKPEGKKIIISGGASKNDELNTLKSELFKMEVETLAENDTSALGAVMVAALGSHQIKSVNEAIEIFCKPKKTFKPNETYRNLLLKRYEIYKNLYPSLKNQYKTLKEVHK